MGSLLRVRAHDSRIGMKVSDHFHVHEFAQPARHGLPSEPYPIDWIGSRLIFLCDALEILREELGGRPIRILSGFRSKRYNARIGGARRSEHMEGRAADISVGGVTPAEVHATALRLYNENRIRIGGLGSYKTFTHIDVRDGRRIARWSGTRDTT